MPRFAVALVASVVGHGLLVAVAWLVPAAAPHGTPHADGGPGLSLSISFARLDKPPAPVIHPGEEEEEWPVDIVPKLVIPPAAVDGPGVGGVPTSPATAHGGGGGGVTTEAGPVGSAVLPVGPKVRRVVYLIDRSISMSNNEAMTRARREVALSLRALPADTLYQVLVYNHAVTSLASPRAALEPADPTRVAETIARLADVAPSGQTNHAAALQHALALQPEVLFLVTDADDLPAADVPRLLRLNHGRAAIHVVELASGGGEAAGPLARLASGTGGSYRRVRER